MISTGLRKQLEQVPYLSEDLVLHHHALLMRGLSDSGGRYKRHSSFAYTTDGKKHFFTRPSEVKEAMRSWLGRFNAERLESPEAGSARLYYDFVDIHPFEDGNGRVGRLLISYWLHWHWKREWAFYLEDKRPHLLALQAANLGDLDELVRFFAGRIGVCQ